MTDLNKLKKRGWMGKGFEVRTLAAVSVGRRQRQRVLRARGDKCCGGISVVAVVAGGEVVYW